MITETFKSKSTPGADPYIAQFNPDTGENACTCRGWLIKKEGKPRECTHTKQMLAKYGKGTKAPQVVVKPNPVIDTPELEPMLASAMTGDRTIADYANDKWVMEPKIDGHRVLIRHESGQGQFGNIDHVIRAVSREGNMRELPAAIVADLRELPNGRYDGELFVPGGKSKDVTRLDRTDMLRLALFDILELRGVPVIGHSYATRRHLLLKAIKTPGRVFVLPIMAVSQANLNALWGAGYEGAMLKCVDSEYQPGYRSANWIKLKHKAPTVVTIVGFEKGKLGPCAKVKCDEGNGRIFNVKTLDNNHLRLFTANPESYIGRKLVLSYTERMEETGALRHPVFDHLAGEGETV